MLHRCSTILFILFNNILFVFDLHYLQALLAKCYIPYKLTSINYLKLFSQKLTKIWAQHVSTLVKTALIFFFISVHNVQFQISWSYCERATPPIHHITNFCLDYHSLQILWAGQEVDSTKNGDQTIDESYFQSVSEWVHSPFLSLVPAYFTEK